MQPDFLFSLLEICKSEGLHTALDTSGFAPHDILTKISPLVDLFLYDLKIMDDEAHRRYTGVSNQIILQNLTRLSNSGSQIIVRIPIIPGINDHEENIDETARYLSTLPNLSRIDILPFHNFGFGKYNGMGRRISTEELGIIQHLSIVTNRHGADRRNFSRSSSRSTRRINDHRVDFYWEDRIVRHFPGTDLLGDSDASD